MTIFASAFLALLAIASQIYAAPQPPTLVQVSGPEIADHDLIPCGMQFHEIRRSFSSAAKELRLIKNFILQKIEVENTSSKVIHDYALSSWLEIQYDYPWELYRTRYWYTAVDALRQASCKGSNCGGYLRFLEMGYNTSKSLNQEIYNLIKEGAGNWLVKCEKELFSPPNSNIFDRNQFIGEFESPLYQNWNNFLPEYMKDLLNVFMAIRDSAVALEQVPYDENFKKEMFFNFIMELNGHEQEPAVKNANRALYDLWKVFDQAFKTDEKTRMALTLTQYVMKELSAPKI